MAFRDKRLIHLLFTEIFLYYGAQKFLYCGLTTEISVPHSTENFCKKEMNQPIHAEIPFF